MGFPLTGGAGGAQGVLPVAFASSVSIAAMTFSKESRSILTPPASGDSAGSTSGNLAAVAGFAMSLVDLVGAVSTLASSSDFGTGFGTKA